LQLNYFQSFAASPVLHHQFTAWSWPEFGFFGNSFGASKLARRNLMRVKNKFASMALGIVVLATMFVSTANAECGALQGKLKPQALDSTSSPASLLQINDPFEPIVGMWHVEFIAEGNTGPMAPPNDQVIDNAVVVWHADGTEIMNSGRAAQDGNFCLGVWQRTGFFRYQVNHFALGNDTTNAPSGIGNPAGPTNITETVILSPDGNHYTGNFTINATDPSGNVVGHVVGKLKATRLTLNSTVQNVL
jgi:hypothetical protein